MRFLLMLFLFNFFTIHPSLLAGSIKSLDYTIKIYNKMASAPLMFARKMHKDHEEDVSKIIRTNKIDKLPQFIQIKPNYYQLRIENNVLMLDVRNWEQRKIKMNQSVIDMTKVKTFDHLINAVNDVMTNSHEIAPQTFVASTAIAGVLVVGHSMFKMKKEEQEILSLKKELPKPEFKITKVATSPDQGFFVLSEFKGKLYAGSFGYAKKQMMYSVDPFKSMVPGLFTGESVCDLQEFNGYFYANTENKGRIFRTSDGNNWKQVFDAPANVGCSLTAHKKYLYATSANYSKPAGHIYRTKNGTKWKRVYSSGKRVEYIREIESYKGKLYAFMLTGKGNTYMLKSSNGKKWNRIKTPARMLRARVIGPYMYLSSSAKYSIGKESAIWKFDGTKFTKLYVAPGKSHMSNVNGESNVFAAVTTKKWKGKSGGASLLVSCGNDLNWEERYVFDEAESWDVAFYNNAVYVATKQNGGGGKVYKVTGICSD